MATMPWPDEDRTESRSPAGFGVPDPWQRVASPRDRVRRRRRTARRRHSRGALPRTLARFLVLNVRIPARGRRQPGRVDPGAGSGNCRSSCPRPNQAHRGRAVPGAHSHRPPTMIWGGNVSGGSTEVALGDQSVGTASLTSTVKTELARVGWLWGPQGVAARRVPGHLSVWRLGGGADGHAGAVGGDL